MRKRKIRLIPGLPFEELTRRIHYHARQGETSYRALGYYLLDLERRGGFRPGFRSAVDWASVKLDLDPKFAQELLRISKRFEELPKTDRAFSRGKISWTKAKIIAQSATKATEAKWLAFAKKHTCAELRAAARRSEKTGSPEPKPGPGLERNIYRVDMKVSALVHAVYEKALEKMRWELGPGATPAEALRRMAEIALKSPPPEEALVRSGPSPAWYHPYLVVIHADKNGIYIWKEGEDGTRVREKLTIAELRNLIRSGVRVEVAGFPEGPAENIQFGERGDVSKEERAPPFDLSARELIRARDGDRCTTCESEENLQACHWNARAKGGGSEVENGYSGCEACHTCSHEGLMTLRAENGTMVAFDREGKPIRRSVSAEEALRAEPGDERAAETPLTVLEREGGSPGEGETAREENAADPDAPFSVEELPPEVDAATWRGLEGHFDWSEARKAFVARPERGRPSLEAKPEEARASEPAAEASQPEARVESAASPQSFSEFVGQKSARENLKLLAEAARREGRAPGHVLLSGAPGLGKTTLAVLLAKEVGSGFRHSLGGELDERSLLSALAGLKRGQVLFLDEVHRLSPKCQELLYSALQDRFVETLVADRDSARVRILRIRLEPFVLVAATTAPEALSPSLLGRFALTERLEPYREDEIVEIAARAARRMGTAIDLEAALEIARLSRGVPREALRLLERSRDLAIVSDRKRISETDVQGVRERLGIDENGLRKEERRILELLLDRGKPIGIRAMAEILGMRAETIEALYEPFLLRLGLIERTERGRVATEKARALRSGAPSARGEGAAPSNGASLSRANGSDGTQTSQRGSRIPVLGRFFSRRSPPPRRE